MAVGERRGYATALRALHLIGGLDFTLVVLPVFAGGWAFAAL